jgi:peptidoglycan/xylan/chitin deacetylase (PgdA/CDA1 family)
MYSTPYSHWFKVVWDVDSEDWKDYGADSIIKSVVDNKNLGNGSIILMHNDTLYTAGALEAVITGLEEKGYEIVPGLADLYREICRGWDRKTVDQ